MGATLEGTEAVAPVHMPAKCFSDHVKTSAQVTLPTTPNTMLVGRYHASTKLHTWALVRALTLSGVPRMGRPKAWSPNRWLSNVSKMTSPGVSSTPAISSSTTSRSLSSSPFREHAAKSHVGQQLQGALGVFVPL